MPPVLELALIVTLAVLLAFVSAVAGALCWRLRYSPHEPLERLVRELADRQRRIERALARLDSEEEVESPDTPSSRRQRVSSHLRFDPPERPPAPGPTLIAVPDLAAPDDRRDSKGPDPDLSRRFGAVWQLADSGASAEAIARATGQPVGQVELILGLRRPRSRSARASRQSAREGRS